MTTRTDTERLDWLQKNAGGCGLIEDDRGHWAFSSSGVQNLPKEEGPADIWTSFEVRADEWKGSLREAIDSAMDQHGENS